MLRIIIRKSNNVSHSLEDLMQEYLLDHNRLVIELNTIQKNLS